MSDPNKLPKLAMKEPDWQECPDCGQEFSYLKKSGLCEGCEKKSKETKPGLGVLE